MDKKSVVEKAAAVLVPKGYQLNTQLDNFVSFQSESREVNWIIVFVLCCLGILPAIIYYYVFAPRHQVNISISGEKDVSVVVTGNTDQARKDAAECSALSAKK